MPRPSKEQVFFQDLKRYLVFRFALHPGDVVHQYVYDSQMHGEFDGPHYVFEKIFKSVKEVKKYSGITEEQLSQALTELETIQTI